MHPSHSSPSPQPASAAARGDNQVKWRKFSELCGLLYEFYDSAEPIFWGLWFNFHGVPCHSAGGFKTGFPVSASWWPEADRRHFPVSKESTSTPIMGKNNQKTILNMAVALKVSERLWTPPCISQERHQERHVGLGRLSGLGGALLFEAGLQLEGPGGVPDMGLRWFHKLQHVRSPRMCHDMGVS